MRSRGRGHYSAATACLPLFVWLVGLMYACVIYGLSMALCLSDVSFSRLTHKRSNERWGWRLECGRVHTYGFSVWIFTESTVLAQYWHSVTTQGYVLIHAIVKHLQWKILTQGYIKCIQWFSTWYCIVYSQPLKEEVITPSLAPSLPHCPGNANDGREGAEKVTASSAFSSVFGAHTEEDALETLKWKSAPTMGGYPSSFTKVCGVCFAETARLLHSEKFK